MKVQIKSRFDFNTILFECELSAEWESKTSEEQLGQVVQEAIAQKADLRGANLRGADLRGADLESAYLRSAYLRDANLESADLRGADLISADLISANLISANLRSADLRCADLRSAYLRGADLRGADLRGADLRGVNLESAYLRGADLRGADLRGANLEPIKNDMFMVLLKAIPEIPFLEKSILEGKIDGSTYEGECACLCGTLEKSGRFDGACDMRDSSRPIERFFLAIKPGDTPENSQFAKLVYEWIQEFKINNK